MCHRGRRTFDESGGDIWMCQREGRTRVIVGEMLGVEWDEVTS